MSELVETIEKMDDLAVLLQIKEHMMGDYSVNSCNGRSLHQALDVKREYRKWAFDMIGECELKEKEDYALCPFQTDTNAGVRDSINHAFTIDAAIHISSVFKSTRRKDVLKLLRQCKKIAEKAVQQQIITQVTNTPEDIMISKMERLNRISKAAYGDFYGVGNNIANAIEAQTKTAQETGVMVELPDQIKTQIAMNTSAVIEADPKIAIAAKVAIGRNYVTITEIAKDFYPLSSTDCNELLCNLGYLKKIGRSTYSVTDKGREYASTRTLASGVNRGKENVTGWNLDDLRFWDVVKPQLIKIRDLKKEQLVLRRKK